jgi:hypothetical protein
MPDTAHPPPPSHTQAHHLQIGFIKLVVENLTRSQAKSKPTGPKRKGMSYQNHTSSKIAFALGAGFVLGCHLGMHFLSGLAIIAVIVVLISHKD